MLCAHFQLGHIRGLVSRQQKLLTIFIRIVRFMFILILLCTFIIRSNVALAPRKQARQGGRCSATSASGRDAEYSSTHRQHGISISAVLVAIRHYDETGARLGLAQAQSSQRAVCPTARMTTSSETALSMSDDMTCGCPEPLQPSFEQQNPCFFHQSCR